MQAGTETSKANGGKRNGGNGSLALGDKPAAKGRKESDGTEVKLDVKPFKDQYAKLKSLKVKSKTAKQTYLDAVKVVAENSGFQASVINSHVTAACGDNFDKKKRLAQQAAIVFEDVVPPAEATA